MKKLFVIIALALVIAILMYGITGAILQFAWASEYGFIGVVVFFAAWVFMFPIMGGDSWKVFPQL